MALKIDSVDDLQTLLPLLSENGLSIDNLEQLREVLHVVNEPAEQAPESRKEELAHKERLQEREHAHLERLRNLEHSERLRALELGHCPPDAGEVTRALSAIAAATGIGIVVPVVVAVAAGLLSFLILSRESAGEVSFFGSRSDLQASLFACLWGVCGLIILLTVLASLRIIRRSREWLPRPQKITPVRQPGAMTNVE